MYTIEYITKYSLVFVIFTLSINWSTVNSQLSRMITGRAITDKTLIIYPLCELPIKTKLKLPSCL